VPEAGGAILQLIGVGMAIAIFTPKRPKPA
jgi:hypothetical protein